MKETKDMNEMKTLSLEELEEIGGGVYTYYRGYWWIISDDNHMSGVGFSSENEAYRYCKFMSKDPRYTFTPEYIPAEELEEKTGFKLSTIDKQIESSGLE